MKTRTVLLSLVLCFIGATVCFAQNPFMGTWKLNEAKSKLAPGAGKNSTVVYEAAGDDIKVTVDGTDSSGNPAHSEWTGKFDGKDYPVTGDPNADTRSYIRRTTHKMGFKEKKGDKATIVGTIILSADGKGRTVVARGTDAQGKKFKSTAVYDKE
ncbi:MAG TPA: hypothetical protein VLC12_15625 [Terriglobales bacterium]|nr:hypothetical protein [Terriglobales bacterium]